jgi:mono/diheme cytochrome c family protein
MGIALPRSRFALAPTVALALSVLAGCTRDISEDLPPPPAAIPAEHQVGAEAYGRNCASCHGEFARGTDVGPPLVHPYYVPGHHADAAFVFAVQRGVAAHHWRFGDMPPQPQVAKDELQPIIAYVRWLQREAGIE